MYISRESVAALAMVMLQQKYNMNNNLEIGINSLSWLQSVL